jgi:hypothetical protein
VNVPVLQLFRELDIAASERLDTPVLVSDASVAHRGEKMNEQIQLSLKYAIQAFASPWLQSASHLSHKSATEVEDIVSQSWRTARQAMLKAINRPSYRSILALYLFSQTPIPIGVPEEEEQDGISGPVCIRTALSHLQHLRARRSTLSEAPEYVDSESRAYWAAMIWDTSAALAMDSRTSLTSGLKGACAEPTWRVVKAFLAGSFITRTADCHADGFEWTDEAAYELLAAASVCKTYIWKHITSVKEAVREGIPDDGIQVAWGALLDTLGIFTASIRPLLDSCERRIPFLNQRVRLNWYKVELHYFLGILMVEDALEVAGRQDLLREISAVRRDAEQEAFNVLTFGLDNTYTLRALGEMKENGETRAPVNITLVALDPYPQCVVDIIVLLHKKLRQKYEMDSLDETHQSCLSILLRTLRQLPQSSKAVREAWTIVPSPLRLAQGEE